MSDMFVEDRSTYIGSLSQDLARHLYMRYGDHKIVIITEKPVVMLSALRKQWVRLTEEVRRARASTLKIDYIMEYDSTLARLRHFQMTVRKPSEAPRCRVFFVPPDHVEYIPNDCRTIYITCPITDADLKNIASHMSPGSLIVRY